jgi:hypothetical protein
MKPKPKTPNLPAARDAHAPALELWPVDRPVPYARNPRRNDAAVDALAASIREFGFRSPVLVDAAGVVIAGHTRLKAARKLGLREVPVLVCADLPPEKVAALRLADNKTAELAEWDTPALDAELAELEEAGVDMEQFGFGDELAALAGTEDEPEAEDDFYTKKVDTVHYEPKMETPPPVADLFDETKTEELVAEIEQADVPKDIRAFLVEAAHRHTRFRYDRIAEFYAHATPDVQRLFEASALVIVDFNDAIKRGWVRLKEEFTAGMEREVADDEA